MQRRFDALLSKLCFMLLVAGYYVVCNSFHVCCSSNIGMSLLCSRKHEILIFWVVSAKLEIRIYNKVLPSVVI